MFIESMGPGRPICSSLVPFAFTRKTRRTKWSLFHTLDKPLERMSRAKLNGSEQKEESFFSSPR